MKKLLFRFGAATAAFIIVYMLIDPGENSGITGRALNSPEDSPPPGNGTSTPRSSPFRSVERPEIATIGKKNYDTGITNDQRVRTDEKGQRIMTEAVEMANRLHSEEQSPEEDLEYLQQIFGIYRLSFQRNPVAGDNQMVMEALLGSNPGSLAVFPANHPSLDANGRLLDRWGNPYFFHALSGTEMEIFSAGPDGELNTGDDIVSTNRDGQPLTGRELEDPQLYAEP